MFNKANPGILGIVFIVLLAMVLLVKFTDSQRGERSFKSNLVSFSKEQVDEVSIIPNNSDPYTLVKKEGNWKVEKGENLYPASKNSVTRLLDQLVDLSVNQVVATSSDNWGEYEVTDSAATKVTIRAGDESTGLRIGKLNFDRQTRSAVSYVRQTGDENVYGVNGFLKMSFGRGPNAYRKKTLVNLSNPSAVSKISFSYPADSSFVLRKNNNNWMIEGQSADSASTAQFINKIKNMKGNSFADNIEEADMTNPTLKVNISGEQSIEVAAKQVNGRWIVHSSLNPSAYFNDSQGNIRDKLFVAREKFLQ
jgi:hypothetical protein